MSAIAELELRRAPANVSTWDEAARTVEVVWAAGADVRRYSWAEGGFYIERLRMTPEAVDLTRLNGGASLLDTHSAYSMSDRVGVVVPGTARVENGQGVATVQLLTNAGGEALADACRSGAGFLVSVGYSTSESERSEGDGTSLPVIESTSWLPMEISAVPIPADPAARTRTFNERNDTMPQPQNTAQPSADTLAERTRAEAIRTVGRHAGLGAEVVERAVRDGIAIEAFRERAFDVMVERQRANNTFPFSVREGGAPDPETQRNAEAEALFARANPSHKLSDLGRQFAARSPLDVARDCLERSGQSTRMQSPDQIFSRALHTTSDFPVILGAAVGFGVREGYASPDSNLRLTGRRNTLSNFKRHFSVTMSAAPRLLKINEHGEFKRGTFSEGAESYGLATYGLIFGITRQALVNDDLGFFGRVPVQQGRAARELELDLLVKTIESAALMADGLPVFSEEHGNLAAVPAALSVDALKAARLSFRKQTDLRGQLIGVSPRYLVVPSELETEAEIVLTAIAAASSADVNPFAGKLTLIVEPRLTDPAAWYLAAEPAAVDGLEYALLEGYDEPFTETRTGFDVDGIEFKVRHDFGAGWVDHRGWYKNNGVA